MKITNNNNLIVSVGISLTCLSFGLWQSNFWAGLFLGALIFSLLWVAVTILEVANHPKH